MSRPARAARRLAVTVAGSLVLVAGLAMLVLPGPGLLGTAAGLAILASEYDWARRHAVRVRHRAHQASQLAGARPRNTAVSLLAGALLSGAGVVALTVPWLLPGTPAAAIGLLLGGACVILGTVVGIRERRQALRALGTPGVSPPAHGTDRALVSR